MMICPHWFKEIGWLSKWSDHLRGLSPPFFSTWRIQHFWFPASYVNKTWRVPFGMDTVQFTVGILTLPIVFYVSYGSPSDKNFPQNFQPLATRPDRRNNEKSLENGPEWVFQIAKSLTFRRKFLDGMLCFGRWKIQVLVVSIFFFFETWGNFALCTYLFRNLGGTKNAPTIGITAPKFNVALEKL